MRCIDVLALALLVACGDKGDAAGDDDADGDGIVASEDCDDDDPAVGGPTTGFLDRDFDGYGDPNQPVSGCDAWGSVPNGDDCDDTNGDAHPGGVEVCDGADNDCDGTVDGPESTDAQLRYVDADGDGYGDDATETLGCDTSGSTRGGDCDDDNAARNPGQAEVCDGLDNDCNDLVDDDADGANTFYADVDGDGYGDPDAVGWSCDSTLADHVSNADDCDDADATVAPGAPEVCDDGVVNDCDGTLDAARAACVSTGGLLHAVASRGYEHYGPSSPGLNAQVVGDLDGDGDHDFVLSDPADNAGGDGTLWVFGDVPASGDIDALTSTTFYGPSGEDLGTFVRGLGDLNGDGYDEFHTWGDGSERHYIFEGPPGGATADALQVWTTESGAGSTMVGAGDVNGDGYDDAWMSAPYWDAPGSSVNANNGAALLFHGPLSAGDLGSPDVVVSGGELIYGMTNIYSGRSLDGSGDLNGDGVPDLVAGGADGISALFLGPFPGDLSAEDADTRFDLGDDAGWSLDAGGDVDGDGTDDVLIIATEANDPGISYAYGGAYVFTAPGAGTLGVSDAAAEIQHTTGELQVFQYSRITADSDGDGRDDITLTVPWADPGGETNAGELFRFLEAPTGGVDTSDAHQHWTSRYSYEQIGNEVSGGDLDGDGLGDLLVGARGSNERSSGDDFIYLVLGEGI